MNKIFDEELLKNVVAEVLSKESMPLTVTPVKAPTKTPSKPQTPNQPRVIPMPKPKNSVVPSPIKTPTQVPVKPGTPKPKN
jgi:hypothetical protein